MRTVILNLSLIGMTGEGGEIDQEDMALAEETIGETTGTRTNVLTPPVSGDINVEDIRGRGKNSRLRETPVSVAQVR